jgi:hypothetical protein
VAGEIVYESTLAWDPERPSTTIITCVDGRWYHHFQEFARVYLKAGARTDFLAVPGGIEPLTLFDLVPKDFNFFRRRMEALVSDHRTERIVAIAHEDCAWYKARKIGGTFAIDLKSRQLADLRRAGARLREMFAGVSVETYFAKHNPADANKVVFESV